MAKRVYATCDPSGHFQGLMVLDTKDIIVDDIEISPIDPEGIYLCDYFTKNSVPIQTFYYLEVVEINL